MFAIGTLMFGTVVGWLATLWVISIHQHILIGLAYSLAFVVAMTGLFALAGNLWQGVFGIGIGIFSYCAVVSVVAGRLGGALRNGS